MKPRGSGIRRARATLVLTCALGASGILNAATPSDLVDARAVLEQLRANQSAKQPQGSTGGQLLADIRQFRATSATLDPKQAATEWLRMLDRVVALGAQQDRTDPALFDAAVRRPVSWLSVIGALPPPPAWPALQEQARQRSQRPGADYHAHVPLLIADILLGDHEASQQDLKAIDTALAALAPDERAGPEALVEQIRDTLLNLYGDPHQIVAAFESNLNKATIGARPVVVPDLVTLVGETEATGILRKALAQPVILDITSGEPTRALARRIALENPEALQVAQWALVDSVEAGPLYEVLQRRFGHSASSDDSEGSFTWRGRDSREEARTYYLLFLLVNGRLAEARTTLESIAGSSSLTLPKPAIEALQKAHQNETLYTFLGGILVDHPEIQAWDVYINQAAYTGHGREALAALDRVLKKATTPAYVRADLQRRRIDALLALDDVSGALSAIRTFLGAHPSESDEFLSQRTETALRLAGLGRVLGRPDEALAGLHFAAEALALPPGNPARAMDRTTLLQSFFAEARKQHREADAQRVAIAEFARREPSDNGVSEQLEMVGMPGAWPTHRMALTEIASLYESANRHTDVRLLLDEAEGWGARDLRDLLDTKDSLEVPLGVIAARALAALGERETAIRIVTATIARDPGYDGAYELESTIDPEALGVFARQFKTDQFEERPLIWTASVLAHKSDYTGAEKAIRAAIAIDPSDGEEGVNDRMRAYGVLADILAVQGDTKGATEYREIVAAIRISEKSDELYHLGLLQRAFAGYRDALGHFSDAYCIQSRLAVQLSQQGHHEEAAEHYRRAYELMPASFGRVESHCFGCESVFDGAQPRSLAEDVFAKLVKKDPTNPRVHYLQGYLLEEEGRLGEALPAFRKAVQIDGDYLNAWRHLNELREHMYLEPGDRDVVTVKLLELDPRRRHVQYDIGAAGNFTTLWSTLEQVEESQVTTSSGTLVYPFRRSASVYDQKQAQLPERLRSQIQRYQELMSQDFQGFAIASPSVMLGRHRLLVQVGQLVGDANVGPEYGLDPEY